MSLDLKNVGATYQKMMNKIMKKHIGRNIEVYVDYMILKTKQGHSHIEDLRETFVTLLEYDLKLNPMKCTFREKLEKFLGFITLKWGIDANPS